MDEELERLIAELGQKTASVIKEEGTDPVEFQSLVKAVLNLLEENHVSPEVADELKTWIVHTKENIRDSIIDENRDYLNPRFAMMAKMMLITMDDDGEYALEILGRNESIEKKLEELEQLPEWMKVVSEYLSWQENEKEGFHSLGELPSPLGRNEGSKLER